MNKVFKRLFLFLGLSLSLCCLTLPLSACSNAVDYTDYISEYRSEIYLAEGEGFTLTAFFSEREYPYAADGVCAKKEQLAEIYLAAPDNTKRYDISFTLDGEDGKTCGGDMSYDSVYTRFFYSQSLPAATAPAISFSIGGWDEPVTLEAKRVKTGNELPMPKIIEKLTAQKSELFNALTKGNSFTGEICIRLIYNEKCYYYAGVTSAAGDTDCFLLDAYTGEILAERLHG